MWQKICAIFGILLIVISAIVYVTRRRNINVSEIIRGYVIPSAEVTFVNFKNDNDPRV